VPPKGAPNVLLIMTDDAGYGVSGTFGGVKTYEREARMSGPNRDLHVPPIIYPYAEATPLVARQCRCRLA